jgi:hypothetical protein
MDSESSTDQEAANVGKRSKHEKAKKGAAQAILFLSIRPSGDESVVSANRLEQEIGGLAKRSGAPSFRGSIYPILGYAREIK